MVINKKVSSISLQKPILDEDCEETYTFIDRLSDLFFYLFTAFTICFTITVVSYMCFSTYIRDFDYNLVNLEDSKIEFPLLNKFNLINYSSIENSNHGMYDKVYLKTNFMINDNDLTKHDVLKMNPLLSIVFVDCTNEYTLKDMDVKYGTINGNKICYLYNKGYSFDGKDCGFIVDESKFSKNSNGSYKVYVDSSNISEGTISGTDIILFNDCTLETNSQGVKIAKK